MIGPLALGALALGAAALARGNTGSRSLATDPRIVHAVEGETARLARLTSARALEWAHVEGDHQRRAQLARSLSRAVGLPFLGMGWSRMAFDLGDGLVLKLPRLDALDAHKSNRNEAAAWQHAGSGTRRFLVPVVEAHPRGDWLVMARASRPGKIHAVPATHVVALLRHLDLETFQLPLDERGSNWGTHEGRRKLLDYPVDPLFMPRRWST